MCTKNRSERSGLRTEKKRLNKSACIFEMVVEPVQYVYVKLIRSDRVSSVGPTSQ